MQLLKQIRLKGWKAIEDQTIDLQSLNVFIGANGAGKSNLIGLLRLLNEMFASTPRRRATVGLAGGANELLHFGSRHAPIAEIELLFQTNTGESRYFARLAAAAENAMVFLDERISFLREGGAQPHELLLGAGRSESLLVARAESGDTTANVILNLIRHCRVFHFGSLVPKLRLGTHAW